MKRYVNRIIRLAVLAVMLSFTFFNTVNITADKSSCQPVITVNAEDDDFLDEPKSTLKGLLEKIIKIICFTLSGVGIVLAACGIGSLIIALMEGDGSSKIKAVQFLVVGVILIFSYPNIDALDLPSYIGGGSSVTTEADQTDHGS